jgi:hypothetical protein
MRKSLIVWKLTLEEFLAGDVVGPTNETVYGILAALPEPNWKAGSIPVTSRPRVDINAALSVSALAKSSGGSCSTPAC